MFQVDCEFIDEEFVKAAVAVENNLAEITSKTTAIEDESRGIRSFVASASDCLLNSNSNKESVFQLSQADDFDDLDCSLTEEDFLNEALVNCAQTTESLSGSFVRDIPVAQSKSFTCSQVQPSHSGIMASALHQAHDVARGYNPTKMQQPQQHMVSAAVGYKRDVSVSRKRKFPGPAGVLPKLNPGTKWNDMSLTISDTLPSTNTSAKPVPQELSPDAILASQSMTDDYFKADAWKSMISDLEPHASRLLNQFSVQSVIIMANNRQLPNGKVPVFCAVIESITAHGADACATLKDPTGKISGTVHRELIKEYTTYFQPGTVVVLRQVSILNPFGRNFYLNITPNNLVRLYPHSELLHESSPVIRLRDLSSDYISYAFSSVKASTPRLAAPTSQQNALYTCATTSAFSSVPHARPTALYSHSSPVVKAVASTYASSNQVAGNNASPSVSSFNRTAATPHSSAAGPPVTINRPGQPRGLNHHHPAVNSGDNLRCLTTVTRQNIHANMLSPVRTVAPTSAAVHRPQTPQVNRFTGCDLQSAAVTAVSPPVSRSPAQNKFTFRKLAGASQASPSVSLQTLVSKPSVGNNQHHLKTANNQCATEAKSEVLRNRVNDISNETICQKPDKANSNLPSAADLWKTADEGVDDDDLFRLSVEFMNDDF